MLGTIHSENEQLIKKIVDLDNSIRFGAICNKYGEISSKFPREGISLHLNEYETSKLLREAANSWHYRHKLSYKLGKGKFALAVYEKLIRLTVPLDQENLLLLTLENFENVPTLVENVHKLIENTTN
ncbi:MAG TPA: DUF6659 family protein [Nitrosopumilaceae archaeon]|nr:DUF6659 family protein [Nitrosopumilaceae archaeon]